MVINCGLEAIMTKLCFKADAACKIVHDGDLEIGDHRRPERSWVVESRVVTKFSSDEFIRDRIH